LQLADYGWYSLRDTAPLLLVVGVVVVVAVVALV
jgi:hypothetical protein